MSGEQANGSFSAEISFLPLFNLALQQNALPVVYDLTFANKSGRDLRELKCVFSAVPDFIHEKTIQVAVIKANEEMLLEDLNIELNYDLLSTLSESMKGKLKLEVITGEETIFSKEYECEAFAPDQWLGMGSMPELLASFVTPNLDVISHLQSSVAHELERATKSPADRKSVV